MGGGGRSFGGGGGGRSFVVGPSSGGARTFNSGGRSFVIGPSSGGARMFNNGGRTFAVRPGGGWSGSRPGWGGPRHGFHRHGHGFFPGFIGGAVIGSALAAPYYYDYGPSYYDDVIVEPAGPSADEVAYCSSRFKSYDPRSGTYLGYDGLRHPCP
jgi:hypothetical protein